MDRKAIVGGMVGCLIILGVLAVIGFGMDTFRGYKADRDAQARVEATAEAEQASSIAVQEAECEVDRIRAKLSKQPVEDCVIDPDLEVDIEAMGREAMREWDRQFNEEMKIEE